VNSALGIDDAAHLANPQLERSVLERLLHLTSRKVAEIAVGRVGRAVGFALSCAEGSKEEADG
jgi:hypothetical protein